MTQTLPATTQLSTLTREISELNDQLAPSRDDEIASVIGFLIDAGLSYPSTIDISKAVSIYCFALSGVPAFGLRRAMEKLIKGEIEGIPLGMIPRPPELAAIARGEAKHLQSARIQAQEKRKTIEETQRSVSDRETPERAAQRERVKQLRQSFLRQHKEQKAAVKGVQHEPMDADQAAHWEKIASLPDAPSMHAEQAAFRRKILSDVAAAKAAEVPVSVPEPQPMDVDW